MMQGFSFCLFFVKENRHDMEGFSSGRAAMGAGHEVRIT